MPQYIRGKDGKMHPITSRGPKDFPDRLAARERARYVEKKLRADRQSNNAFDRHAHQIVTTMSFYDKNGRRKQKGWFARLWEAVFG